MRDTVHGLESMLVSATLRVQPFKSSLLHDVCSAAGNTTAAGEDMGHVEGVTERTH